MSHSSGKKSSNPPKFQITPFGIKVMGLNIREPSPSIMSFGAGVLNDEPVVESYVSGESSAVSEKMSSGANENVVEKDFADSGLQMVVYKSPVSPCLTTPLKTVYPVPDSPEPVHVDSGVNVNVDEHFVGGKSSDATVSEEVHLKRKKSSEKSPVPDFDSPIDIPSGDESSDNVPIASIARKMRKRVRGSAEVVPSSKKAKFVSGSSKSKKSLKKTKGKKMFVGSSSKKRSSERIKSANMSAKKKGKGPMVEEVVELDVEDIGSPAKKKKSVMSSSEKKRKAPVVESVIEHDVQDIRSEKKKKKSVRKGESSVTIFHSQGSKDRWPFVIQRRIPIERPLGPDVKECEEVMALIERAGLLKSVSGFGKCYVQLVREFISNLTLGVAMPGSDSFQRVFVRGKCVVFSPDIINSALDRSEEFHEDIELDLDLVAREISAGSFQAWPPKKLLSSGVLSVKYAILSRIGMLNWIPSNHTSAISVSLARLIFWIGTGTPIDFGSFVFEQTMKHAESFAVKLPISFPSLLSDIILKQYPDLVKSSDVAMPRGPVITLDHRLFQDPHVLDIALPASRTSANLSVSGSKSALAEMEDLSKELQEVIRVTTLRKEKVDSLICKLRKEGVPAVGSRDVSAGGYGKVVADGSQSGSDATANVDVDVEEDSEHNSEHDSEDKDAGETGSSSD